METFREIILLLGAALVAWGIALIYAPAGVIAAGVLLIVFAVLDGYDDNDNEGSGDAK